MESIPPVLIGIACVCLYLLPTLIANIRVHKNIVPIAILNVSLGWTLVGWIGALMWSSSAEQKDNVNFEKERLNG